MKSFAHHAHDYLKNFDFKNTGNQGAIFSSATGIHAWSILG